MRVARIVALCAAPLLWVTMATAEARTYRVGPPGSGRPYTRLDTFFDRVDLQPGDIVEVDGDATYAGGIVVGDDDDGTAQQPVVIRWRREGTQARPVIHGGLHAIKFEHAHHVVFEGFEVTGGSMSCVFNESHGVIVRDAVIHDCPSHGVLGADQNSGDFTLEYSELYRAGAGTTRHTIYAQNDQTVFPDAVFRMRFNYVHDGNGGILMRSRYSRSEIHFNWFEASAHEEIELIGPDCEAQKPGWSPDLRREDADLVGNVIVHTADWRNAIRLGGDLVGRSQGRVRMVNNTVLFLRDRVANAVRVQLGAGSVEMHNNVIWGSGTTPVNVVEENFDVDDPECAPVSTLPWAAGRKVAGSGNWVERGAAMVPPEWRGTLRGDQPGLVDVATRRLRPRRGSPLVAAGMASPAAPGAFAMPWPLPVTLFEPPIRSKLALGRAVPRQVATGKVDIGALGVDRERSTDALNGQGAARQGEATSPEAKRLEKQPIPPIVRLKKRIDRAR